MPLQPEHMPPRARIVIRAPEHEPFSVRHPRIAYAWRTITGVLAIVGLITISAACSFIADAIIYGGPTP